MFKKFILKINIVNSILYNILHVVVEKFILIVEMMVLFGFNVYRKLYFISVAYYGSRVIEVTS